ncbi:MAG: hypothetical protein SOR11_12630 [Fusobacterium sp.]|uniref:hypothetical protein n=1 Tax=Fusobacterium sp. TaxID=68766 RepID=UPI002A74B696|nr:hypothetical protein [Fusobacterium sp.]MDY3060823.1 hypothetical protein [Fusobacterium sp.]
MILIKKLLQQIDFFNFRNGFIAFNPFINYSQIDIYEFINYIFERDNVLPFEVEGEDRDYQNHKYNGIMCEILDTGKTRTFMVLNNLDFLEEIKGRKFVVMSPITYIGRNRTANNSRYLYAFAIDLDGVEEKHIGSLFKQFSNGRIYPPNIIVSSGNGLHLYYILKEPIALFDNVKVLLKRFKYGLIDLVWSGFTSKQSRQYQGIFQGFRVPETQTKFGEKVRAYINYDIPFYDINELNKRLDSDIKLTEEEILQIERVVYKPKRISLAKAKELYPDWYERRIVKGDKSRKKWDIKRDLYDWWKRKITSNKEVQEGHRYFCLMTLAMYATKCNISYEELKEDAYAFLIEMEQKTINQDNHFTKEDIEDALRAYKESYITFPRKDIERITGLSIPANKRNGRKQVVHLMGARAIQEINDKVNQTNWRQGNGRKEKKDIVREWRLKNPLGKKIECEKQTGLSRHTVLKWWEKVQEDIEEQNKRYKEFSNIPFEIKRKVYRKAYIHYHSDYCLNNYGKPITTEEERKENIHIDYFYFLLKEMKIGDEKLAEEIYKKRVENKNFIRLKQLIKRQGKRTEKIKNLSEFYSLIDKAESEEKLKEICSKYDFLPNLELF